MKERNHKSLDNDAYNTAVKQAYFKILKKAKHLLSTIEKDELRFILERQDSKKSITGTIVHELVSPLLYLRLEHHSDNIMAVHFGIEQADDLGHLSIVTTSFLRLLYKYTSKEVTGIDIEHSVRTDWFINSCSDMYEYIEERDKYHMFKQIKYKNSVPQRKATL